VTADASGLRRFGTRAEELGDDSLWGADRLFMPREPRTSYPGDESRHEQWRGQIVRFADPLAVVGCSPRSISSATAAWAWVSVSAGCATSTTRSTFRGRDAAGDSTTCCRSWTPGGRRIRSRSTARCCPCPCRPPRSTCARSRPVARRSGWAVRARPRCSGPSASTSSPANPPRRSRGGNRCRGGPGRLLLRLLHGRRVPGRRPEPRREQILVAGGWIESRWRAGVQRFGVC